MVEKHAFVSPWESSDQAMVIKDKNMCSYDIPAIDQPSAVVFEFFHSKNRHRRDPVLLPVKRDLSTDLRIASVCYVTGRLICICGARAIIDFSHFPTDGTAR
jgi:hypothetical protein